METTLQDVIILGAGPSGLFCALHLPKKANVLLLEKTQKSATKLLLSAKGRGNLTNRNVNPMEDYVSDNNKFVKSAFENYGVQDFLSFLDQAGFPTREEENGRILLQSGKVAQFHEFLLKKVAEQGKTIAYQQDIQDLEKNADGTFTVKTASSQFLTHNVILATGTKSIPILGSSDIALQIAHKFNLPFRDFFPALVGLETQENLSELSGSSLLGKGELYENGKCIYQETWPILFTHWGLSGPVIFNASRLLSQSSFNSLWKKEPSQSNKKLSFKIKIKKADITKRLLTYLGFHSNTLEKYVLTTHIIGKRGFEEAKVCGGGIATNCLKENFEVKNIPWLFIIGECLDCTGKTGGFNLQRCWASGAICGKSYQISTSQPQ